MIDAIVKIAAILPVLEELRALLESLETQFEPLANYEKRLLEHKVLPTNAPIRSLNKFFTGMRRATNALSKYEETITSEGVPTDVYQLYITIRDIIYRSGKYAEGGVNQNPDGLRITVKNIKLGNPPGTFKKSIDTILGNWKKKYQKDEAKAAAYSIEAWNTIKNNFGLINKIELFKKKIDHLASE